MKKFIYLIFLFITHIIVFAQLNGNYTIGGSSPNFTTLNGAVSALTTNGISAPNYK